MLIRPATSDDAPQIRALFRIILKQMELKKLRNLNQQRLNLALELSFKTKECRLSKGQIIVAEVDGEVAGMAFGYPSQADGDIDELLCHYFPKVGLPAYESLYDNDDSQLTKTEWYLDSLAVKPKFRGLGIATAFLKRLPKIAARCGKTKVSLDVDLTNPKAKKLYRKLGFKQTDTLQIGSHRYHHLMRAI